MEYTREKLIEICDRAIVPVDKWSNRDTPRSQMGVGECWALLKAGCEYRIRSETNDWTIWVEIEHPNFYTFECDRDELEKSTFCLPTEARLKEVSNGDWY